MGVGRRGVEGGEGCGGEGERGVWGRGRGFGGIPSCMAVSISDSLTVSSGSGSSLKNCFTKSATSHTE